MLRIKPILEEEATDGIKQTYVDIKKTFDISFVPLLFQYLANFEEYFIYLWGKTKININTDYFTSSTKELIDFTNKETIEIYTPSSKMVQFIHRLHGEEKEHIQNTVDELQILNSKLLIITIALREGVKGVIIGQEQMLHLDTNQIEVDIFDIFHTKYAEEKEVEPAENMLAPLFGSKSITISKYPSFFTHIALEMENLTKQENYLQKRVELERLSLKKSLNLFHPTGCSYKEIMAYAGHRPHLNELIYILAETFPTQFPRLLITTSVMEVTLKNFGVSMTRLQD